MEDLRKQRLRKGLAQLDKTQILRLLDASEESMVMDEYYYYEGRY